MLVLQCKCTTAPCTYSGPLLYTVRYSLHRANKQCIFDQQSLHIRSRHPTWEPHSSILFLPSSLALPATGFPRPRNLLANAADREDPGPSGPCPPYTGFGRSALGRASKHVGSDPHPLVYHRVRTTHQQVLDGWLSPGKGKGGANERNPFQGNPRHRRNIERAAAVHHGYAQCPCPCLPVLSRLVLPGDQPVP